MRCPRYRQPDRFSQASFSFFFPFSAQHPYNLFSLFAFLLILLNWSIVDGELYPLRFEKICQNHDSFPKISNETYIYEFRSFYFVLHDSTRESFPLLFINRYFLQVCKETTQVIRIFEKFHTTGIEERLVSKIVSIKEI